MQIKTVNYHFFFSFVGLSLPLDGFPDRGTAIVVGEKREIMNYKSLLYVGLVLLTVVSCTQRSEVIDSGELKLSQESSISKKTNFSENPLEINGDIRVWMNDSNELIAFAETSERKHIFILQYSDANVVFDTVYSKLTFLDHVFCLESSSGSKLVLGVDQKEESITIIDTWYMDETSVFYGQGIIHIWLSPINDIYTDIDYTYLKSFACVMSFGGGSFGGPFGGGGASASCDSGGQGATSCSTNNTNGGSGCSVSCSSGYYACCNNNSWTAASCNCIKN